MTTQYMWLLVFGVILYVIVVDPNVARAFDYVLKLVNTNIRRELWWLKNNPANPVVKYIMYRKNLKLTKELREKINKHLEAKE